MKLIYIAGPYRAATVHGIKQNIRNAEIRAEAVVKFGNYPVSPHLCTAFMDGLAPDEQLLEGGMKMLEMCSEVWLCAGWERSSGTRKEIARAIELGKLVLDENGERVLRLDDGRSVRG